MKCYITLFVFLLSLPIFSQVKPLDSVKTSGKNNEINKKSVQSAEDVVASIETAHSVKGTPFKYNPTKAGLYSAVLPGLGQYYNKKYWKIPIVWGAIGTGVGISIWNQNQYKRYRGYFIDKLNGTSNPFLTEHPWLDDNALGNLQDTAKRQRDYAMAVTALVYILNIIDAVVDAHLYEGRKDPDLAVKPTVIYDEFSQQNSKAGISFTYRF